MNGQKNMRVDFYRVENDLAPLVEVNYWDRENHECNGLLLLDTGSNINALFGKMADEIERFEEGDISSEEVLGIGERSQRMERICFAFKMGDYVFNEPFLLTTEQMDDYMVGDMPIIGIVGNIFLQRHRLAIDYASHSLYTSDVVPAEFVIEEYAYFYPMHMGLKFYGLPIVGIKGKDGEVVALVDTGSTDNSLTFAALKQHELPCAMQEGICGIWGICGRVDARKARVEFDLLGFSSKTQVSAYHHNDDFLVVENPIIEVENTDDEGDVLPAINMLLGSQFLGREGWVLDFGTKVMYKRKAA